MQSRRKCSGSNKTFRLWDCFLTSLFSKIKAVAAAKMTHQVDKVRAQGVFTWSQNTAEIIPTLSWRYVSVNVYIQHIRKTSGKPVNANDVTTNGRLISISLRIPHSNPLLPPWISAYKTLDKSQHKLQYSHIQPKIRILATIIIKTVTVIIIIQPGGALIRLFDSNYRAETVGPVWLIINSICVNIGNTHQVDRGSQERRERDREKRRVEDESGGGPNLPQGSSLPCPFPKDYMQFTFHRMFEPACVWK